MFYVIWFKVSVFVSCLFFFSLITENNLLFLPTSIYHEKSFSFWFNWHWFYYLAGKETGGRDGERPESFKNKKKKTNPKSYNKIPIQNHIKKSYQKFYSGEFFITTSLSLRTVLPSAVCCNCWFYLLGESGFFEDCGFTSGIATSCSLFPSDNPSSLFSVFWVQISLVKLLLLFKSGASSIWSFLFWTAQCIDYRNAEIKKK